MKGARRPTLQQVLVEPKTNWTPVRLADWYGAGKRAVEICTDTAVWYHTGLAPVEIRWVLIRDPQGEFDPQALLSTTLAHRPRQRLEGFVRRWTMEVTLEEARAHLGIETQRQRNDRAIARTTLQSFLISQISAWFCRVTPPPEADDVLPLYANAISKPVRPTGKSVRG